MRVDYTLTTEKPGTPNESYSIWRRTCRADTTGVAQPLEDEARVASGLLPKTATTKIKPAALTEFTSYAGSTATLPHFRCVKTVMSGTTLKNCNQIAVTMMGGAGDVVRIQASRGVANTYLDDNGELDARDVPDVMIYRDPNQRWEDPSTGAKVQDTVDARSITRWEGGSCPPTGEPSAAQRAAGCHIVRRRFFTPLIYTRGMPKGSAVSTLNYSVYFDDPAIYRRFGIPYRGAPSAIPQTLVPKELPRWAHERTQSACEVSEVWLSRHGRSAGHRHQPHLFDGVRVGCNTGRVCRFDCRARFFRLPWHG